MACDYDWTTVWIIWCFSKRQSGCCGNTTGVYHDVPYHNPLYTRPPFLGGFDTTTSFFCSTLLLRSFNSSWRTTFFRIVYYSWDMTWWRPDSWTAVEGTEKRQRKGLIYLYIRIHIYHIYMLHVQTGLDRFRLWSGFWLGIIGLGGCPERGCYIRTERRGLKTFWILRRGGEEHKEGR